MTDHHTAEAKALFKVLHSPLVNYLNHGRLFASETFLDLVEYATEAVLKSGNVAYANQLLVAFSGTGYSEAIMRWFHDRAATEYSIRKGKTSLRRRGGAIPRIVSTLEYFPEAHKSRTERKKQVRIAELEAKKGLIVGRRGVDLMDTRLRLPGSFGHSKRR